MNISTAKASDLNKAANLPASDAPTLPRTRTKAIAPWKDGSQEKSFQGSATKAESSINSKKGQAISLKSESSISAKKELSFLKKAGDSDEIKREKHKVSTDLAGNPVQAELSFLSKKSGKENSPSLSSSVKSKEIRDAKSSKSCDNLGKSSQDHGLDRSGSSNAVEESTTAKPKASQSTTTILKSNESITKTAKASDGKINGEASLGAKSKTRTRGNSNLSKLNENYISGNALGQAPIALQDIADEAARLHLLSNEHKPAQKLPSKRPAGGLNITAVLAQNNSAPISPMRSTKLKGDSFRMGRVSPETSGTAKTTRVSAESSIITQDIVSRQNSFKEQKSRLQIIVKQRNAEDQAKLEEMKANEMKKFGEWVGMIPGTIMLDDLPQAVKAPVSKTTKDKIRVISDSYRLGRRMKLFSEGILKGYLLKVKHNFGTTDGVLQELQKELEWATKLEDLLKIKPLQRAGDVIQQIDKILKTRVPEYAKSADQDRYHLCKWVSMEKLPKNRVLLWEEHIVTCFYMILVGKVEFFKLNGEAKLPLCIFQAGSMFGHARIKVAGATRTACAATASETWMLTVDRGFECLILDDFMSTSKKGNADSFIDSRANSISGLGILAQMPEFFKKIAVFFHFQSYERGEIIQAANEKIDRISFVISGSCKVTVVIPLIAQSNYDKVILKPCPVRKSEFVNSGLEKCEEVEVETQSSLIPGDWIPYIPLARSEIASGKWTKETIFLHRFKNLSECQVTAADKVVMASVPFEDFMDLALDDTLKKFLDNTVINRYPIEELQAQYLSQNAWEEHKKQTVQDIIHKKAEKKAIIR